MAIYDKHEYVVLGLIEAAVRNSKAAPINLGGIGGFGGGAGGPPGGFIGRLPQYYVTYDASELATLDTLPSGVTGSSGWSLVDNLNHIRYRLQVLESGGGGGAGSGIIVVDDNNSLTYTGIDTVHFVGSGVIVTNLGGGEVEVRIDATGTGGSGGGFTQEQIEDIVGAMVSGNTETGITVTYDDTLAKLNFVTTLQDAPLDENIYGRQNGNWVSISGVASGGNRYLGAYNYWDTTVYRIGLVTSQDTREWNSTLRPAISLGTSGAFDDGGMAHPCLVQVNGVLYLYYGGYDGGLWKIGLARSYDEGLTWIKESGAIISPTQGWENSITNEVNYPKVIYDLEEVDSSKKFKMWYNGGQYGDGGIGYAYSADGVSWTKSSANPVLTKSGSGWESYYMAPGAIAKRESTYILFYCSSSTTGGAYGSGYATFSNPEGTYTKYSGNPIISGDGITSTLSSTVNINDTQATVANANLFPIGAAVWVYNASARYLTTVKSRISSTILEFNDAAPVQITSSGGSVRSASYNSITIESVLFDGGWLLSITAFQAGVHSLSMETALLAWANPSLTSCWIDYGVGYTVPFNIGDSVLAPFSDENLNFIDLYSSSNRIRPTETPSAPLSLIVEEYGGTPIITGADRIIFSGLNVLNLGGGDALVSFSGNLEQVLHKYNEDLSPTSSSTMFTTNLTYASGTLRVYYNGIRQRKNIHYIDDIDYTTFSTYFNVYSGDCIIVDYDYLLSDQVDLLTDSDGFTLIDSDGSVLY